MKINDMRVYYKKDGGGLEKFDVDSGYTVSEVRLAAIEDLTESKMTSRPVFVLIKGGKK